MKSKIILIYTYIYTMFSLGMNAVLFVPNNYIGEVEGSSSLYMASWVVIYLFTILILLALEQPTIRKSDLIIFIIPAYFFLSSLWSIVPAKTVTYSLLLIVNSLHIYILVRLYDLKKFLIIYRNSIVFLVFIGIVSYFFSYSQVYYLDPHDRFNVLGINPIRGFFNHKITAGYYAVIGFFMVLYTTKSKFRNLILFMLFTFICMTGSSTALALLLISYIFIKFLQYVKKVNLSSGVISLILISSIIFIVLMYQYFLIDFLILLDRDPTLTGRTLLWQWGIDVALQKPFLGWGYLGYNETEIAYQAAQRFEQFQNYNAPHFHNSYVQYLAEAGILFGGVFILFHFYSLYRIVNIYLKSNCDYVFITCYLLMILLTSSFFVHNLGRYNNISMLFVMFVFSYVLRLKSISKCRG